LSVSLKQATAASNRFDYWDRRRQALDAAKLLAAIGATLRSSPFHQGQPVQLGQPSLISTQEAVRFSTMSTAMSPAVVLDYDLVAAAPRRTLVARESGTRSLSGMKLHRQRSVEDKGFTRWAVQQKRECVARYLRLSRVNRAARTEATRGRSRPIPPFDVVALAARTVPSSLQLLWS
jgi:hypothetical protein